MSRPAYVLGSAGLPTVEMPAVDEDGHGDGGRDAFRLGYCSRTEWIVDDWTRQADARLDALRADTYDLADQVRWLGTTVVVSYLVLIIALSIVLAVAVL